MRSCVVALVVFLGAVVSVAGLQQQPAPPATPAFRAGVDLVQLDVSVFDKDRHTVRGLTADDFTLFEEGRPQQVGAFAAIDVPDPDPVTTAWMREVAPDVRSNSPVDHRLVLIIIDDAAIQANVGAMANVKQIAHRVIDHLGPADLATVVFTRDNRNAQEFTADRARLLAAADKFTVGFRDMGGTDPTADELYLMYSANVVDEAIKALADVPERRKALIYIGQGVPADVEKAGSPATFFPLGAATTGGEPPAIPHTDSGMHSKIFLIMEEAFARARRANVSVYPIDVCGIRMLDAKTCAPGLEVEYLQTLAENTGGRAVFNTNDFEQGIEAIFRENDSYYLIGYRPTHPTNDGKLRRLEVKVNRPGLGVRTRNGYEAMKAAKPGAKPVSPLAKVMSGILPVPDIALQVDAAPFAKMGGKDGTVAVVLGVRQSDLSSANARITETLDLQTSAFTPDGASRGWQRQTAHVVLRAAASGDVQYEVISGLDLKPGRYSLRLAAHSSLQNKSGSVYVDVDVPDFTKDPVSLSGVVLTATPSPASAPKGGLTPLLPVVPTTRREFVHGDDVAAFVRIYQGGKQPPASVALAARIEDSHGAKVLDVPQTFGADRFNAARAADYRLDLPINTLAPGAYLLTIEVTLGKTAAKRNVRFVVR